MSVPGRREAARLLVALDPPSWHVRHAVAVADVAACLARAAAARGHAVDGPLVEAAALLHDADKALPAGDPARALPHGEGSAAWLARLGHPELAEAVRDHPVTRLADPAEAARLAAAPLEARLVAYADKRAGARLEPMAARFASWRRRYPDGPAGGGPGAGWQGPLAAAVWARAEALERDVCAVTGLLPGEVRRVRWAAEAVRAARAARTLREPAA